MAEVDRFVFVSYAHADLAWIDRLKVHLRPLIRQGALTLWDDSQITPGQVWEGQIAAALARSRIAILLVSADFLASEFIANNELPPLLHRAAAGGLLIVPLIVGPCLFAEHAELSRYQTANDPGKPLSAMPAADAEAALVSLARSVDRFFRQLDASTPTASRNPLFSGPQIDPAAPRHRNHGANLVSEDTPAERLDSPDPMVVSRPINLGFDGPAPNDMPMGWFNSFGHVSGVSTDYEIRTVARSAAIAEGTCAVLHKTRAKRSDFGSLMQRFRGRFLAGQSIRLEGELRTEDVTVWAGLWLRADSDSEPDLFFDNMAGRPIVGTTRWKRYSIDALLPEATVWLNYGVVLVGPGAVYADNLRLLRWSENAKWEDV